jgi:hypothetical protein
LFAPGDAGSAGVLFSHGSTQATSDTEKPTMTVRRKGLKSDTAHHIKGR